MTESIKKKIRNNSVPSIGAWQTLAHPSVSEIMCQADFDWVCIDLEHSSITLDQAEVLIRTIDRCSNTPLVRLSSNDSVQIKRIADAGAHGIIVPMVNNLRDLEHAHKSLHYPPTGFRGAGLARAQNYGSSFQEYVKWSQESLILVAQIEHIEAVHNLEEIFSFEPLDAFIIGPYDLSASLGVPGQFEHPEVIAALAKIKELAQKYNKCGGIHVVEPDLARLEKEIEEGYRFLAYSVDIRILDVHLRKFKQALEK